MNKKNYNQAPLPFMGQKRKFLKEFKTALKTYPQTGVYVDLFGGSGLLAHNVKRLYPTARVVYNDFDNYRQRIEAIPKTNKLLAKIRMLLTGQPKDKIIGEPYRSQIIDLVKKEKGFVDYITLSSSLLFSMNYATSFEQLCKQTFYNCVRLSDYNADGYLDGLEVISTDYKQVFNRFQSNATVFLIDPPYLSTECGTYNNFWKLSDYLDVLDTLKAGNYFYFTSNKSNIVELCEWVATKTGGVNPFAGAEVRKVNTTVNYSSSYTDIMIFKNSTVG